MYAEEFLDIREMIEVGADSDDLRCMPPHMESQSSEDGVLRMPRAQWDSWKTSVGG